MDYRDDADSSRTIFDEEPAPPPPPPPPSGCWKWFRRFLLFCFVMFLLVAAGIGWLYWTTHQVPEFYQEALAVETPERAEQRKVEAVQFQQEVEQLGETIQSGQAWEYEITQDQINAWLAEELPKNPGDWPKELQNPRVALEEGRIQIGATVDTPVWKGVGTLVLRPRFEPPRTFVFDIDVLRIGQLAIPIEKIRAELPKLEDGSGLERDPRTGGYRYRQRLTDEELQTLRLTAIEVAKGRIRFAGKALPMPEKPVEPGEDPSDEKTPEGQRPRENPLEESSDRPAEKTPNSAPAPDR